MNQLQFLSYRKAAQVFCALLVSVSCLCSASRTESEQTLYGPENMMKTLPTPFTTGVIDSSGMSNSASDLAPIGILANPAATKEHLLSERFHGPKLFLPPRMVLGQCSEFIVQGPPGSYVAIAMADKDSGAKPVYGHELKLGPDRKLVAVGKITDQGTVTLSIEAPIQGDLVGSSLYFAATVWSKSDFSDMQTASVVSAQKETSGENGVIVCEQPSDKKPSVINLGATEPMSMKTVGGLSSGKPVN